MYTLSSSSFCYLDKTYHMRYSIYFTVRWQMQKGCNSFPLTFIYEHSRTGTRSKGDVTVWLGKLNYFAAFVLSFFCWWQKQLSVFFKSYIKNNHLKIILLISFNNAIGTIAFIYLFFSINRLPQHKHNIWIHLCVSNVGLFS